MANYEIAFLGFLGFLAFYFIHLSEHYKIQGYRLSRALVNGILNTLLKMLSVATVIYMTFFTRLILEDQTQTASMVNILKVYDSYFSLFIYGFAVIFFICFFILQFINLLENMRIYKEAKRKGLTK